jgi:hypothetical protein
MLGVVATVAVLIIIMVSPPHRPKFKFRCPETLLTNALKVTVDKSGQQFCAVLNNDTVFRFWCGFTRFTRTAN